MSFRVKLFYILAGCTFLLALHPHSIKHFKAEESLKVDLKKELKKGNLLIGLKQYLGGEKDFFSKNKTITFKTKNGLVKLNSFNGIKYKSKEISISWKDIPLKTPYKIERFVFGPYPSYESARKKANFLKEKGLQPIVTNPDNWEVWVNSEIALPDDEFKYKFFNKIYKTQITPYLNFGNSSRKLEGPIYISANEDVKINNINFGKKFFLIQDLYGTWTLIQQIKFDNYLKGVLPHEIGLNSPLEALKAQAIIARTWAIYNSERFNADKYHLCITTQCQVYQPFKIHNKKVQEAINETSNKILTFGNKPINSFYHGSNGGISATSGESWEMRNYPYFQVTIDGSESLNKFFRLPISNETQLNKFLDFDQKLFYGKNHNLFRWEKKISSSNIIDELIKNKILFKRENLDGIKVISRGVSGRVTKLEVKIKGVNDSIILEKDNIRRIFSFLPSTLLTINNLNDDFWLFKGGGFGHGVGLSQAGAIEMAKLGFSYEEILNHYYKGAKIQRIKILSHSEKNF